MSSILSLLSASRPVMSVVTVTAAHQAVPLARALVAGGLPAIEVTLRTEAGLDAIRAIAGEVEGAIVGAGTILTPAHMAAAQKAGARFTVSPGATAALLAAGRDSGAAYLPGVATASELMTGLAAGYDAFKLFPASIVGGVPWLKAMTAVFPKVRFCPTGGIDLTSAPAFLALPNVACIGGSWTAPAALIEAGDFDRIRDLARAAVAALG